MSPWVAAMSGLTFFAVVMGAFFGLRLSDVILERRPIAGAGAPSEIISKYVGDVELRQLPPIIANLTDPADAWVRLQASIVFDRKATPKPDMVAAQIAEDILGFMRTLSIAQIGGASGLQHLREDLNERATIRSNGLVRELIIQTLVMQ